MVHVGEGQLEVTEVDGIRNQFKAKNAEERIAEYSGKQIEPM